MTTQVPIRNGITLPLPPQKLSVSKIWHLLGHKSNPRSKSLQQLCCRWGDSFTYKKTIAHMSFPIVYLPVSFWPFSGYHQDEKGGLLLTQWIFTSLLHSFLESIIHIYSIRPTEIFFLLMLYEAQIKSFQSFNLTIVPGQLTLAFQSSRISSLFP